jgi:hypothetical protein
MIEMQRKSSPIKEYTIVHSCQPVELKSYQYLLDGPNKPGSVIGACKGERANEKRKKATKIELWRTTSK